MNVTSVDNVVDNTILVKFSLVYFHLNLEILVLPNIALVSKYTNIISVLHKNSTREMISKNLILEFWSTVDVVTA